MTRETRIGLVVGLGFIIMFGLVLTELTGTNSPAPPPPNLADDGAKFALAPVEQVSPSVGTREIVPTPARPAAPTTTLAAQQNPPLPTKISLTPPPPPPQPEAEVVALIEAPPPPPAPKAEAHKAPEPSASLNLQPPEPEIAAPEKAPGKRYVVQPKDTLIKIARAQYGQGHEKEYKRIYEANKKLLADEKSLVIGQELLIPPLPEAKPAGKERSKAEADHSTIQQLDMDQLQKQFAFAEKPAADRPSKEGDRTGEKDGLAKLSPPEKPSAKSYVVQPGDTLSKIARKMLKSDSKASIGKIVNANKDKLPNPEKLQVGMKLEIPS